MDRTYLVDQLCSIAWLFEFFWIFCSYIPQSPMRDKEKYVAKDNLPTIFFFCFFVIYFDFNRKWTSVSSNFNYFENQIIWNQKKNEEKKKRSASHPWLHITLVTYAFQYTHMYIWNMKFTCQQKCICENHIYFSSWT